jgi:ribonuclease BN (tRNA processing enzyme)
MKKIEEKNRIVFLGTGGGKNIMFTQVRKTGGIYIKLDDTRFIIDPGPGSLVHAHNLKLRPEKWDCLLVSHFHPDHCTDANVLLDGMFHAGNKKPFLIAEKNCLKHNPSHKYYHQCISNYHQGLAEARVGRPGSTIRVNSVDISIEKSLHYDPTIGFKISSSKKVGYPSDTTYYKGQEKGYENCDVLILNVLIPRVKAEKEYKHMSVDDAIKLVKAIKKKPELIIITHFSFWMLQHNVWAQAGIIERATGIKTIPAEDFMEVELDTLKTRKLKEK